MSTVLTGGAQGKHLVVALDLAAKKVTCLECGVALGGATNMMVLCKVLPFILLLIGIVIGANSVEPRR